MSKADPGVIEAGVRVMQPQMQKFVADNKDGLDEFNRRLIASGLKPDAIGSLAPITVHLGMWMGECFRDGVPLNTAIGELEDVVASPIETLLEECQTDRERVRAVMLKAAMTALAFCCEPGRVVEAAAFVLTCSSEALTEVLTT